MKSLALDISAYFECLVSIAEYGQLPFYRRAFNWVCGIDQQLQEQPEFSEEELAAMAAAQTNIDEKPYWRRFTLAQAIILMFVASFICGFFAYSEYIVPSTTRAEHALLSQNHIT